MNLKQATPCNHGLSAWGLRSQIYRQLLVTPLHWWSEKWDSRTNCLACVDNFDCILAGNLLTNPNPSFQIPLSSPYLLESKPKGIESTQARSKLFFVHKLHSTRFSSNQALLKIGMDFMWRSRLYSMQPWTFCEVSGLRYRKLLVTPLHWWWSEKWDSRTNCLLPCLCRQLWLYFGCQPSY